MRGQRIVGSNPTTCQECLRKELKTFHLQLWKQAGGVFGPPLYLCICSTLYFRTFPLTPTGSGSIWRDAAESTHTVISFMNVSFKMAENIIEECAHLHVTCVSIGPNLKPEVAHWAAASACDCGRTGGHSFCQTHWDWWSGLERRPGVFSYSNGPGRDSWTLYIALWACTCAYLRSAVCMLSIRRCIVLRDEGATAVCQWDVFRPPQISQTAAFDRFQI